MRIDLGGALGGVAIAISVLDDYFGELHRIGRFPASTTLRRDIGGSDTDVTFVMDPPRFMLATSGSGAPYTRVRLSGTLELRPPGQPGDPPEAHPLQVDALATLFKLPTAEVGLRYDGVDGVPSTPLVAADIDALFAQADIAAVLDGLRLQAARSLIEGLNPSLAGSGIEIADDDTGFELTLMPAGADTVDSFAMTVPLFGSAVPALKESFVPPDQGLAVAYNRVFLDLALSQGADAKVGTEVEGAEIKRLSLQMTDDAIQVDGAVEREVTILPNVNISFVGPMHPRLVRGTTVMSFDMDDVVVTTDQDDSIFYTVLKWFVTILSGALLFTGLGSLTLVGIALWATAVQAAWNANVDIENAPNMLRDNLAALLGAELSVLSDTLDDDTPLGSVTIDATPDSLQVVAGNLVLLAQVLVVPIQARLASGEYSRPLKRFVLFELEGGRRFRAQELARLMAAGKVAVPGFHQVNRNYLRANHDDVEANNLLQRFKANPATEPVLPNQRR